jgi:hypothetical protein
MFRSILCSFFHPVALYFNVQTAGRLPYLVHQPEPQLVSLPAALGTFCDFGGEHAYYESAYNRGDEWSD